MNTLIELLEAMKEDTSGSRMSQHILSLSRWYAEVTEIMESPRDLDWGPDDTTLLNEIWYKLG